MWLGCAKMAEWIDILFGVETPGDPRNIVLDGGPHPPWHDMSSMQILPNYFEHLFE